MIARIVLGIIIGFLLVVYFPLVLRFLPFLLGFCLAAAAFYTLRAAPGLAEPLAYGLLVVFLVYFILLFIRYKGKMKAFVQNLRENKYTLPRVAMEKHPQISVWLTLILYTLGLTFVIYLLILLIYVQ